MTKRITEKDLERMADEVNSLLGAPMAPHGPEGGNVGNYHISYANGGACLHKITSHGGAVADVFNIGHVTKRELFNRLDGFTLGLSLSYVKGYQDGNRDGQQEAGA